MVSAPIAAAPHDCRDHAAGAGSLSSPARSGARCQLRPALSIASTVDAISDGVCGNTETPCWPPVSRKSTAPRSGARSRAGVGSVRLGHEIGRGSMATRRRAKADRLGVT